MNFKQYLQELYNIEVGQAIDAHEPTDKASMSVVNPNIVSEMNIHFMREFNEMILSPEIGLQKIRKVLHRYGFDMPALYDADPEGDEIVFEIDQYGQGSLTTNIYILYYLSDEGSYDFYAEIGDESRMNELLSDEGDLEEEE